MSHVTHEDLTPPPQPPPLKSPFSSLFKQGFLDKADYSRVPPLPANHERQPPICCCPLPLGSGGKGRQKAGGTEQIKMQQKGKGNVVTKRINEGNDIAKLSRLPQYMYMYMYMYMHT